MDSLSVGASLPEFTPPTTFPFQRLPMELQLLMLQHFLVSPAPILNPSVPLGFQKCLVEGEEHGQDQINSRIIFTCKLFYEEGLPLLYGHNVFMYTEPWTAFSYTLSRCVVKGCQRCGMEKSSPPSPEIFHPPSAPCDWNLAFKKQAMNVNLRLPFADESDFLEECEDLLRIVDRFINLQTLQFDFLDICDAYVESSSDDDECLMYNLQSTIQETMGKLQDPNRSAGALKELVLTGLPRNGVSLYVVKQFTRLLTPHGRMGVGWGEKGRRYELCDAYGDALKGPECAKRDDLELLSMSVEEVEEWIKRESQTMGISGDRWWIEGQEEPESGPDGQSPLLTSQRFPESEAWWEDEDYGGDLEALLDLYINGSGQD